LHLFWPAAIDCRFEPADQKVVRHEKGQGQANNESAPLEARENHEAKREHDQERLPDFHVADCRHEQIERRVRPSFVDEMKKKLIHEQESFKF
jgi:hypothetical protein